MNRKTLYWIAAIGWTVALTVASLISLKGGPKFSFSFADKLGHAIFYFIFTIVWFKALSTQSAYTLKKSIFYSGLFAFFYGILIEILQENVVENRQGDWKDVAANTIGIIVAITILRYFVIRYNKLKRKN